MRHVIAIDQGTTGSTVLVLDEQLAVRGRGYKEFRQIYPQPGWVEHDPEDIWASVTAALATGAARASTPQSIAAIGITNQRETAVIWDRKTGKPAHNAIVWQDRRTADRCAAAQGQRQGGARQAAHRPHARPVLLGHEAQLDARQRARRSPPRARSGAARVRHDRFVPDVAAHRRRGPRDRRHERVAHAAVRPQRARRGATSCSSCSACRARCCPRSCRRRGRSASTKGVPGLPRRHPDRGHRRRSAGGAVRPGVLRAGRREVHVRHRRVHPDEHRRRRRSRRSRACSPPSRGSSRTGELRYALEGSAFIAGAAVQWLRDGLGIIKSAAEIEALARIGARLGRRDRRARVRRARRAALASRRARRRSPASRAARRRRTSRARRSRASRCRTSTSCARWSATPAAR